MCKGFLNIFCNYIILRGILMLPGTVKNISIFLSFRKARIRYVILCLLMLNSSLFSSALSGYFLCTDSDGHVETKFKGADHCCESPLIAPYNIFTLNTHDDSDLKCCTDRPTAGDTGDGYLLNASSRIAYNSQVVLTDFICADPLHAQYKSYKSFLEPSPHHNIPLLSFSKTISLLI